MEKFDILKDLAERTGGDVYIGVVGPVRTGKSTFIKRFMDLFVLPNIKNNYDKERTKDELPQSGAGKTIMTTEPKFVPNEAVEITVVENVKLGVRLVDCVGYTVRGASGYEDENGPRMVHTPWFDYPIPFGEAAEIGTRKVIADHSTIGLVVTTDGTITDIARDQYIPAEERVVKELQELGKPFAIVLNTLKPHSQEAKDLAVTLQEKYGVPVMAANCMEVSNKEIEELLGEVLYEFPIVEVNVDLPQWVLALDEDHWLSAKFQESVIETVGSINKIRDVSAAVSKFQEYEFISGVSLDKMDLGSGTVNIELLASRELFYSILEEFTGIRVEGDHTLLSLMKDLSYAKREYDKLSDALKEVKELGYGIVAPRLDEITFEEPEIIRHGNRFGVKLKATAPSLHIIRADIQTEVTPFVGTEKQGEEMVKRMTEEFEVNPEKIWNSEFLGKSLHEMMKEGIQSKLIKMPDNAQSKLQETLQKIVNEGSGGLICIIL